MSAPVVPDPDEPVKEFLIIPCTNPDPDERVKDFQLIPCVKDLHVMWTMEADIQVRNEQFTDAQGQPREPELLDAATLLELARERIGDWPPDGDLNHDEGGNDERTTDYEILNCAINGDIEIC